MPIRNIISTVVCTTRLMVERLIRQKPRPRSKTASSLLLRPKSMMVNITIRFTALVRSRKVSQRATSMAVTRSITTPTAVRCITLAVILLAATSITNTWLNTMRSWLMAVRLTTPKCANTTSTWRKCARVASTRWAARSKATKASLKTPTLWTAITATPRTALAA